MLNLIQDLQESLIYKMSLGSKELYHSNIWAWIINREHSFVNAFTIDVPTDLKLIQVTREEKNRDLTLWYGKSSKREKAIVIENKLKAIPTKVQLGKYKEELKDTFYKGILTGFIEPNFKLPEGWVFVSYSKLTNAMLEILEQSSDPTIKMNKAIINEYLDNNIKMGEIVNHYIENNKYSLRYNDPKELDWIGLQDLVNKMVGSLLANYLESRLINENLKDSVEILQAFHHKSPTIDIKIHDEAYKTNYLIQIEGYEYRRFIWRENYNGTTEELFNEFVKKGFFDGDFKKENHLIEFPDDNEKRKTSMKRKYCSYKNNCVYQYFDLNMKPSFEELYELVKNDVLVMKQLKDRRA